jgi:hypothetical protein
MKRIGGWILGLYILYLFKSAIGIDILPNRSAWWWLKLPIAPIMQARDASQWQS